MAYAKANKKRVLLCFFAFCFLIAAHSQCFLTGTVKDAETNSPLPYATLLVLDIQKAFTTDSLGNFNFPLSCGAYKITISFIGYKTDTFIVRISDSKPVSFFLYEKPFEQKEVIITSNLSDKIKNTETGVTKIEMKEISKLPVFMGETDLMKILQLSPGVQSSKEGGTGIYIRGGSPDQNLILLDDAALYNPFHLFGFFPAFNADIISDIKLIKSGIGAGYGSRIASVIEVNTIDSEAEKLKVNANLGLLTGRLYANIPVVKNKIAFQIATRTSFVNEVLKPFKNTESVYGSFINSTGYNFNDLNLKLNLKLSGFDRLSVSAFYSSDKFMFTQEEYQFKTSIGWTNRMLSARWNHIFNNHFFSNLSLNMVDYRLNFDASQTSNHFTLFSSNTDLNAKIKFTYILNHHIIRFGSEFLHHTLQPTDQGISTTNLNIKLTDRNIFYSNENSFFVSDEFSYKNLIFNAGLRFSIYNQTGPYKQYLYDKFGEVTDSMVVNNRKIIKTYFHPEPRFTVNLRYDTLTSFKLSITKHAQYIHMAPISSVTLPADIWVPSTAKILPQTGWQFSGGYYRSFSEKKYEISVELYYKYFRNIIEFKNEIFSLNQLDFEKKITAGKGYAYGLETFAMKKKGKLTGWISYTLAKAMRQFDDLNNGRPFPAKYDRTHDLAIVANYEYNQRWTFSAVFNYATGNALTLPTSRYLIHGNVVNHYETINGYRMPPYHRLDFSATYFFKIKRLNSEINFSVYNLYNRANPYFIYYLVESDLERKNISVKPQLVSLYPILPSFSWKISF